MDGVDSALSYIYISAINCKIYIYIYIIYFLLKKSLISFATETMEAPTMDNPLELPTAEILDRQSQQYRTEMAAKLRALLLNQGYVIAVPEEPSGENVHFLMMVLVHVHPTIINLPV